MLLSIFISIHVAPCGPVKPDRLLDIALQCKTILQCLNLFAIFNCRFISREHIVLCIVASTLFKSVFYYLHMEVEEDLLKYRGLRRCVIRDNKYSALC